MTVWRLVRESFSEKDSLSFSASTFELPAVAPIVTQPHQHSAFPLLQETPEYHG